METSPAAAQDGPARGAARPPGSLLLVEGTPLFARERAELTLEEAGRGIRDPICATAARGEALSALA